MFLLPPWLLQNPVLVVQAHFQRAILTEKNAQTGFLGRGEQRTAAVLLMPMGFCNHHHRFPKQVPLLKTAGLTSSAAP
ncbi:hypothetical protein [Hymenobacter sp. APR13]|uniref:hypothetical protein n=1 Tax=Hymenobacter sp. APR13 TaxID=1356852 RepID=UPI0012E0B8B1|nr:hypothetical protein [Hymenobacter sp. APR13]